MLQETAAIYCRLSQDDGSVGESGSIQTQKSLLTQYCNDNHIIIGDYYCDDGWSGTNFERPDFKRMLEDIENRKINLVIVKDLSRFGREYAQMGLYIEHYFEKKGVRFISVAENIDSKNGVDNLVLPFTNVINSYYARQSSTKTKAAHRARAKDGLYLGGHAPFGYLKDPNDRHKLIVDPDAAEVVRKIFRLFIEGEGLVRITKILREESILNPQAYFNQNNPDYYKNDYWRKPFDWHVTSVRVILSNHVYLGKLVFGKTKTKGFFDKKRIPAPEEEWIIVDDTHEALITQEQWDIVQQLTKSKRRENTRGEIQPFAGLVRCASCGSALNLSFDKRKGKYTGFSCWVYKNYGKQRCTSHAIGWKAMNTLILNDIRRNAACAKFHKQEYLNMLLDMKSQKRNQEIGQYKRTVKTTEKRLAELEIILNKLYEDVALEKISEERYRAMAATYETEQGQLAAKRDTLLAEIAQSNESQEHIKLFLSLIRKHVDTEELNTRILNELIEKIVVHEKEVDADGVQTQRVDIYYKFIGHIDFRTMEPPKKKGDLVMMTFDETEVPMLESVPLLESLSLRSESQAEVRETTASEINVIT